MAKKPSSNYSRIAGAFKKSKAFKKSIITVNCFHRFLFLLIKFSFVVVEDRPEHNSSLLEQ